MGKNFHNKIEQAQYLSTRNRTQVYCVFSFTVYYQRVGDVLVQ
jgi:hypothetical protein